MLTAIAALLSLFLGLLQAVEIPPPSIAPPSMPPADLADARGRMLGLVNADRRAGGLNPVTLGSNRAPQLHAESLLAHCAGGHWGVDGTKSYMRNCSELR